MVLNKKKKNQANAVFCGSELLQWELKIKFSFTPSFTFPFYFLLSLLHLFSSMKSHCMTKYTLLCSKVSVKWHKEFCNKTTYYIRKCIQTLCKTSNSSSLLPVNVFHPESGLKKLLNEYLSLIWY